MKWIKKQRIITRCLKGVLAMVILSAMLGLAACRADTGSHINNTGAGAEIMGCRIIPAHRTALAARKATGSRTVPLSRIMTQTNPGKMNQGGG